AVGSDLVRLKVAGEDRPAAATPRQKPGTQERRAEPASPPRAKAVPVPAASPAPPSSLKPASPPLLRSAPRPKFEKPLAAPAVRLRARGAGMDLRQVRGPGPAGRITHEDLDGFIARGRTLWARSVSSPRSGVEEVKIVGLRRRIAERMALANARIPH